ncbi:hypothetical protein POM88_004026 [Heracleum sosnowskyi]|uniref:GHMP kinase N-terminal domain-containing protein n=1 Tax=Heracleum sosnowskyi TaxID=360622 RepID=A0AAD8JIP9_9APIA|nr:hypothetical protein POM88_004026 [Heracleum sosnowskyi]
MAICKVFNAYCKDNNIKLHKENFSLSYDTNIPRQTGLSGSSAIVERTWNCCWSTGQIHTGLPGVLYTWTSARSLWHGVYTPINNGLLPPLQLISAQNPSDSGKVHSTVQQRWLNGDEFIKSCMEEVANLPLEGRSA